MVEQKICQNCRQEFTIEPADFDFYAKMQVPPPTFCPHCRMMRRFLFRSEHYLNRRKDSLDGKEIFSGVPVQSPYKVYDHDYWWSDAWSALDYGREYDFSRPFFAQFKELLESVPWCAKTVLNMTNSEYSDQSSYGKNAYLCFDTDYLENCSYLINCNHTKDSFDLLSSFQNELCYEGVMVTGSYRTLFSENCDDCRDVWFSKNCVGCSDCLGCVNLRKKQYHIFNKPYSKEEYQQRIKEYNLGSHTSVAKLLTEAQEFWKQFPVKYLQGLRNTASSGDYLNDTKNAQQSFLVRDAENVKFLQYCPNKTTNSYDYTVWGDAASQMYECLTCGMQVDSLKFCFDCWPASQNLEYSVSCRSSHNLFGCVGLRNKEYCIFNRQYSKEEYIVLREKIIRHMNEMPYVNSVGQVYKYGEFFPPEFSAFAYNQTIAQDLFPLTKEEALKKGYSWRDPDQKEYETTLKADQIPDRIQDIPDTISKEIIECESCKRAYRVTDSELMFYRRIGLPLPYCCIDCRIRRRFSRINPPRLYDRTCMKCQAPIQTSYSPERKEIVYCERCYQNEIL